MAPTTAPSAPIKDAHALAELTDEQADTLLAEAETLMAAYMEGYDPSHDVHHVRRVRSTAAAIARSIAADGQPVDTLVVELGAIFHDLVDHKYSADAARLDAVRELLARHGLSAARAAAVLRITENTGFSTERRLRAAGRWTLWHDESREFMCVQDADRLDAIGAIGIMRVAAYAAHVGDPLAEDGAPAPGSRSAHQHFYDKLLTLKDTMRTPLGRQLAAERHAFMLTFLEQLCSELPAPRTP